MPIPKNEYAAHYYVELDLMRYIETTHQVSVANGQSVSQLETALGQGTTV